MRILALETSTEACSCALHLGDETLELVEDAGQRHSSILLPMVEKLLAHAGIGFSEIDAVAFGAGPGAFTGLRIACSVAQGLAFARDLPVLPVITLEALAEENGASRVLACLDARMGELYLAAYERKPAGWDVLCAPRIARPDALPALEGVWQGSGSGFRVQAEALAQTYQLAGVTPQAYPRARAIAALGARALAAGGGVRADVAAPLYLRDKVALDVREQAAARAARQVA